MVSFRFKSGCWSSFGVDSQDEFTWESCVCVCYRWCLLSAQSFANESLDKVWNDAIAQAIYCRSVQICIHRASERSFCILFIYIIIIQNSFGNTWTTSCVVRKPNSALFWYGQMIVWWVVVVRGQKWDAKFGECSAHQIQNVSQINLI